MPSSRSKGKPITDEPPQPITLYRRLPNKQYGYAFASGLWEPYVAVGDAVEAGQAMGAIHFPWEPWRDPLIAETKESGIVYSIQWPAKTAMGQILFILVVPFEG